MTLGSMNKIIKLKIHVVYSMVYIYKQYKQNINKTYSEI